MSDLPQRSRRHVDSSHSRVASPTSIRHISSKRVNENSSLLGRTALSLKADPLISEVHSLHKSDPDIESIIYQSIEQVSLSLTSKNQGVGEYAPVHARNIDDLLWSVILPYYLPILSWLPQYCWRYFIGDLLAGISLATFQIPLSLSYSTTLAKVPVISGLYSLGVTPLIYMLFGSVPQMIVGPEAPISLVVGQAVEPLLHHAKKKNLDPLELVVAITFVSGTSLLGFGLGRFGFLDNVLNESLLKGFISGVGIVMILNAVITMLGLNELLEEVNQDPTERDIHTPFDKFTFLLQNFRNLHSFTFQVSIVGFLVIMAARVYKKRAVNRNVVFIPEILIVVVTSTFLCYWKDWESKGIDIIGPVRNDGGVAVFNPFTKEIWKLIKRLSTSGFLCAMLGFFELTIVSKSLGSSYDLPISSNRELVALGTMNIFASIFGGLPAFGGYGRSKINAISARTTTSGAIMGVITLFTAHWITDYIYYVPKCMLSVIAGVIGISLIEEAPREIFFHWRSKGYNELITFAVTVLTTLFFSMEAGIAVGLVYSLIRVIKHSAGLRIQILGRRPGTNQFVDADSSDTSQLNMFTDDNLRHLNVHMLEEIEGCLIVRIPEPLTFVNATDLESRLKRVELYGSTRAHPASKRSRDASMTKYIIFDLDGMSELDSLAAHTLKKLLQLYQSRGIQLFFVRVHHDPSLRRRLVNSGIVAILISNLRAINYDPSIEEHLVVELARVPYFSHISEALGVIDRFDTDYV